MKPSRIVHKGSSSDSYTRGSRINITLRIALMSWLVTLITLIIFASLTIPQQKEICFRHLLSKANSVALSLHGVAAGAAINEDFASVVSACQTLMAGDPDLEFLMVMKNDRFSLFIEQDGWRSEPKADVYWIPPERQAVASITLIPGLGRRAFHYAQPFDYSGIEWGWIHVGLSLKDYDRSVVVLYRNTALLAVGCILLSLLIFVGYAGKMVEPILRLRQLVQEIAGGDLSVRADVTRHDELGSLAESVNTMTEALLRRDQILESVRFAAQKFMQTSQWEESIDDVLEKIGGAAEACCACVFENHRDDTGQLSASKRYEWKTHRSILKNSSPGVQEFVYKDAGFDTWIDLLGSNKIISGPVSKMGAAERAFLEPQNIRSLIVIPVFVEEEWWGFLGLEDCVQERLWSDPEKDSLRTAADMLGATIVRQQIENLLVDAKTFLERRVKQRTQELETQVAAKEQALEELATTQSTLVEMSRAAGMAEVATGVLHNVGNVLNSVNVSCTLVVDQLRESRLPNLTRVLDLMREFESDLAYFLTEDSRGRNIPKYLNTLASTLQQEQDFMIRETQGLHDRIQHIKEIVSMQQTYGRVSGMLETLPAEQLMEDALKLNAGVLARYEIKVQGHYDPVPPITVDKHKVLQILLNLINNAKHACNDGGASEKIITLGIFNKSHDCLTMQVSDNGVGILPENLTRIFHHGFTTRVSGHGFGLHSGALTARELHGTLTAHSDGPGRGATFTLELPFHPGDSV